MKRYNTLIVEPSTIVREGLVVMLNSTKFNVVASLSNIKNMTDYIYQKNVDILIINPVIFTEQNKHKIKNYIENYPHLILIGLLYNYVNSDILSQFHLLIDICDTRQKIEEKILSTLEQYSNDNDNENYELSAREKDILVLVAKGMMNKEIADKLNISIHTVISHRKNIIKKTNIKSVAGLTVYALLNNLIDKSETL